MAASVRAGYTRDRAAGAYLAQGSSVLPIRAAEFCLKNWHAREIGIRRNCRQRRGRDWPRSCSSSKAGPSDAAQSKEEGAMTFFKGLCRAVVAAGALAAGAAA